MIATAFVFGTTENDSVAAAKTRVAATALSFALCFVYLVFLPFHARGLAVLITVGSLLLFLLGKPHDVGVAAITTGAVMVIAALGPHLTVRANPQQTGPICALQSLCWGR